MCDSFVLSAAGMVSQSGSDAGIMTIIAETSAPVRGPGRGHASAIPSGHTSTGILHMQPSRPVECDSKPLDLQFAFE